MSDDDMGSKKGPIEKIQNEQSNKESKSHNNPIQTMTFGNKVFDLESKCNDSSLIKKMIEMQLLDSGVNYKMECKYQNYIGYEELGKGVANTVYSISGMENKVFRISNKHYMLNQSADGLFFDEMAGYFIQCYLSNICPNICKVYDFGFCYATNVRGVKLVKAYAILEKVDSDLMTYFEGKYGSKPFTTEQWFIVLKDILTALDCIHKHGYAHLDIKPENMGYNSSTKKWCLFDFDNALFFPPKQTIYVTTNLTGTAAYLAPELYPPDERIKAYRKYTRFADIYPFSVILHSCSHYVSDFDKHVGIFNYLTQKMGSKVRIKEDGTPLVQMSKNQPGYYDDPLAGRISAEEGLKIVDDYELDHFINDINQSLKIMGGSKRRKNISRKRMNKKKYTKKNK